LWEGNTGNTKVVIALEDISSKARYKRYSKLKQITSLLSFNSIEVVILGMQEEKKFSTEEAQRIGEELGIDWTKFDIEQFRMGLGVELEHGLRDSHTNVSNDDPIITGKIALAHLNEYPDYYTRLDKMEREAEEYWSHGN